MTTEEKLKEMLGDYYEMGVPGSPNAAILQNMLGADNELRDPQSENEALLKLIYEDGVGNIMEAAEQAVAAAEHAEEVVASIPEDFTELEADVLEIKGNYAKQDGSYEGMTVGNAEQLVSTVYIDDAVPYTFRTSGGTADIGDREYDKIVGGSLAWNQLMGVQQSSASKTENGVTITDNRDGTYTVSTTASGASANTYVSLSNQNVNVVKGHKYLLVGTPSTGSASTYYSYIAGIATIYDFGEGVVFNATASGSSTPVIAYVKQGAIITTPVTFKPQYFDLTQMFGSTIADYIYSLEQSTAGAGVAWFRKLFPADYYPYNPGELISVSGLQSHDMTGFNQFDKTSIEPGKWISDINGNVASAPGYNLSDYIHVIPNTRYYKNDNGSARILYYDANKTLIPTTAWGAQGVSSAPAAFTTLNNAHYMRITLTDAYLDTFCLNLSWDGERDGEYEPYVLHSYPLDSSLTLRGIPKLDANNSLYYDGDTYEADGKVTRRYGIVDLGTLNYTYQSDNLRFASSGVASLIKKPATSSTIPNVIAAGYTAADYVGLTNNKPDFTVAVHSTSGDIYIINKAYTDVATFKTAMSGVYLVYELATPTEETADPYQSPQVVDDFGTEEYVTDSIVPVGHETRYTNNLRAKLEMAPDSPDGDGDYIVRQTNGENAYVPLTKELPTAPTTDGSYVLKVTVTNGTPAYTWEVQE